MLLKFVTVILSHSPFLDVIVKEHLNVVGSGNDHEPPSPALETVWFVAVQLKAAKTS